MAFSKIEKLLKDSTDEIKEHIKNLDKTLPGNITVEMSHQLYRISETIDLSYFKSSESLYKAFENGQLGENFETQWNQYLKFFGHRGYQELDIMSPRNRELQRSYISDLFICMY